MPPPTHRGRVCWSLALAVICCFLLYSRHTSAAPNTSTPVFSFGIISDVQWADVVDGTSFGGRDRRYFRGSLAQLSAAVDYWISSPPLSFVVQLGDLVDGRNARSGTQRAALEAALSHLRRLPCRVLSLTGNHDFYNFERAELAALLRDIPARGAPTNERSNESRQRPYYAFTAGVGWRVVVLSAYEDSVVGHAKGSERHRQAEAMLAAHNPNDLSDGGAWFRNMHGDARRWVPYNGGFGREQLEFLRRELKRATKHAERVILLSHVILSPRACEMPAGLLTQCDGTTIAWDFDEALALVAEARPVVAMVISGHDHHGGYHYEPHSRVHHLTLRSPLNEGAAGRAYARVLVHADRIELRGPRLDDVLPTAAAWPGRPPTLPPHASSSDGASAREEAIHFAV